MTQEDLAGRLQILKSPISNLKLKRLHWLSPDQPLLQERGQPAAPIFNRLAIQFMVIVVSWRSRRAIWSFCPSPLRRCASSEAAHRRRFP
jgi:hypothetical protein